MFSLEQALAQATRVLAERRKNSSKKISYVLYYSNDEKRYDGKVMGYTIKELINQFRGNGGNYKYAFITRINDDKPLRFYNRDVSKKFFSLTRTGKKKK